MSTNTDRIEKTIVLAAPRERVWSAISDARQFGIWFGVALDGAFAAGARLKARIVPTQVDDEIAKAQKPMEGVSFDIWVERVEPMRLLSFRWHPYEIDPKLDPESQPTTRVTFELADAEGGTRLTITESGFDGVPIEHRAKAFESNAGGWAAQATLITKYLAMVAKG